MLKKLCMFILLITMLTITVPAVASPNNENHFIHKHDPIQLGHLINKIESLAEGSSDYSIITSTLPTKNFLLEYNPNGYNHIYYNITLIIGDDESLPEVKYEHTIFYTLSRDYQINELYLHARYQSYECPVLYDTREMFAFYLNFMSTVREYFSIPDHLDFNNPRIVYENGDLTYETGEASCTFGEDIRFVSHAFDFLEGPQVYLNGNVVEFDVQPVFVNGTTFVPMGKILEELGADVRWNQETNTVVGSLDNRTIKYQIGARVAEVNGKQIPLREPGFAQAGRTMIPLRFFSESLGHVVGWEGHTQSIMISSIPKTEAVVSGYLDDATIQVTYTGEDGFELIDYVR